MAGDGFNSPFLGLQKDLKGRKKSASSPQLPKADEKPKKAAPAELSHDFGSDDEAASAMFMAAMSRSVQPAQKEQADKASLGEAPQKKRPPRQTTKQAQGQPPRPEDIPDIELDSDEAQSFARAMQGVRPVDETRGRALAPPAPPAPIRHKSAERDYLADFTEGKYEFALEYTEEFFEGHVMGTDPLVVAKLRAGQYSPETHIDLHGLNAEQAYAALLVFVKEAYNQGRRNLVVVTGRGKNSPGGLSVLRQNMQDWLTKEPLRRVVLAFCTAQPKDGGAGALYVLLRKFKKSTGKIRWDKGPWEEKPLI